MFVGIGFICVPIAIITYNRINRKRDEAEKATLERGETNKYSDEELRMLGDRAPDFRYVIWRAKVEYFYEIYDSGMVVFLFFFTHVYFTRQFLPSPLSHYITSISLTHIGWNTDCLLAIYV